MEENVEKKENKAKIAGNVIFYTLLGILLILAGFSITTKITKGRVGNSQYLVVISSSMDGEKQYYETEDGTKYYYDIPTIPVNSLIKIDLIADGKEEEFYSSLKKGDVLTFNYVPLNNVTITHRIVEDPVDVGNGVYKYVVRGDAVEESEIQTLYSDGRTGEIIGKVTFTSLPLGQIYSFLSSRVGRLVLIIIPASCVCIYEIVKIGYIVNKGRKEKIEAEKQDKEKEIEELKKQLEEMKKEQKVED